jgi:drug/metabolite transporter (DMT)-like permease
VVLRRILLGTPIRIEVVIGATSGLLGIMLIFVPEFQKLFVNEGIIIGLLMAFASFLSAAFGNIASERILDRKTAVIPMNFWCMTYGVSSTLVVALLSDVSFALPSEPSYYYSLAYLAVFGSMLAFGAYMKLIQQVGSDKAAYVVLVYPIVALIVSTFFEGYKWTEYSIIGIAFVLLGNFVAMGKANRLLGRFVQA